MKEREKIRYRLSVNHLSFAWLIDMLRKRGIREWRHFCRMRCPAAAHPDMRVIANMLLTLLKQTYPVFFEDIEV